MVTRRGFGRVQKTKQNVVQKASDGYRLSLSVCVRPYKNSNEKLRRNQIPMNNKEHVH